MQERRRDFLRRMGSGLVCGAGGLNVLSRTSFGSDQRPARDLIFGWTSCLTYQAGDRRLGYEYFSHLLDEMRTHGMSRLIVMMASHGYFSPGNHGLAWPVKHPKLRPQVDTNALNAHEETEFFSRVIEKAHRIGIQVFIEIKYLGMIGVREGYPGIEFLTTKEGRYTHQAPSDAGDYERRAIEAMHICCDSEPAHQYMRDKTQDVLERYRDLDGIVFEHPSYTHYSCYCESSRRKLLKDTGKDAHEIDAEALLVWKSLRIRDRLVDLKNLIKRINPKFAYGFYTGVPAVDGDIASYQDHRGHRTETLAQVGFDFVMPYCEGRNRDRETRMIERVIDHLTPLPVYLHTTIRRDMPRHYELPPKGPQYVRNVIAWGKAYARKNERFLGMTFFNEVKIPEENRQAVYDSI